MGIISIPVIWALWPKIKRKTILACRLHQWSRGTKESTFFLFQLTGLRSTLPSIVNIGKRNGGVKEGPDILSFELFRYELVCVKAFRISSILLSAHFDDLPCSKTSKRWHINIRSAEYCGIEQFYNRASRSVQSLNAGR